MSDPLQALECAAADTCSLHCPSVKRADEAWTHTERCRQAHAAIAQQRTLLAALDTLSRYKTTLKVDEGDRVRVHFVSYTEGPWVSWNAIDDLLRQHREER